MLFNILADVFGLTLKIYVAERESFTSLVFAELY